MKILLIGSGGREHAIAAALIKNKDVQLYAAPGNPGIAEISEIVDIKINNFSQIIQFCQETQIDMVFVGPEQPLADGIADILTENSIPVFGPSRAAAMLESSKDYAKHFMTKYNIPTAKFKSFSKSEIQDAIEYIRNEKMPIVIKADGLAAGKGVIIADDDVTAISSLTSIFEGEFGAAGEKVVIEEFMTGEEASVFAVCDGNNYITLAPAQDHKRVFDGDMGKNTGGMGAYAPADLVNNDILDSIKTDIIDKVLIGMQNEGSPFVGCLYVGLMINNSQAKVVEFNCRFGDPETQAVLSVFDGDFASLIYSAAAGNLNKSFITNAAARYATCVILASEGYPESYNTGFDIKGLDVLPENSTVFHSGTKILDNRLVSAGGRVLGVTGTGDTLLDSIDSSYNAIKKIHFDNMFFRKDIGKKGLK